MNQQAQVENMLRNSSLIGFDVETTTSDYLGGNFAPAGSPYVKVRLLQLANELGDICIFQIDGLIPLGILQAWYDSKALFIGHNVWKYDLLCLKRAGLVVENLYRGPRQWVFWDTMQAELFMDTAKRATRGKVSDLLSVSLKNTLFRVLGVSLNKEIEHTWNGKLTERQIEYAQEDVAYLIPLYRKQRELMARDEEQAKFASSLGWLSGFNSEMEACFPVFVMEYNGMPFSEELMWKYIDEKVERARSVLASPEFAIEQMEEVESDSVNTYNYKKTAILQKACIDLAVLGLIVDLPNKAALEKIKDVTLEQLNVIKVAKAALKALGVTPKDSKVQVLSSRPINLNSSQEVKYLIAKWGYKVDKTDKTTLQTLYHVTKDERLADLLNARACKNYHARDAEEQGGASKEFGQAFVDAYVWNGCLHGKFNPLQTVTGRLSSNNPNMQNRPRDSRQMFVAPKGKVYISCDYKSIEMFMAAVICGDEDFITYVNSNDPHTKAVSIAQGVSIDKVDKKLRNTVGKLFNFSLIYGSGANSLQRKMAASGLSVNIDDVSDMRAKWLNQFPTLMRHIRWAWDLGNKVADGKEKYTYRYPNGMTRTFDVRDSFSSSSYGGDTPVDWSTAFVFTNTKTRSVGNRILNNIVQGNAAVGMKMAMIALWRKGVREFVSTIHDELNFIVDEVVAEERKTLIEATMIDTMLWVVKRLATTNELPHIQVESAIAQYWKH